MSLITVFVNEPVWFVILAGLLGLIVGSFLNVVIYRLPVMLEREWREQCAEFLQTPEQKPDDPPFNLVWPGSRCPHCGHVIGPLENIPVLSYLFLRGKCLECKQGISLRYPLVELTSGVLAAFVAWHFGFGWAAVGAILLTWSLIALTGIDFDKQLLPDNITLPFLWLGLLFNLFGVYTDLPSAVLGAVAGYMSLWLIYQAFRLLTGKEGMGYGDFKLFALLGAWMGWQMLPLIILLSSVVGAVVGITLMIARGHDHNVPIPFGPYLAAAGWIALIWGEPIMRAYLQWTPGGG